MDIFWYFATILHLFLCLILVVVVLLQQGKGSDVGAAFGGGSTQTMFGSRGPASFFHYVTTGAATLFMATSLYLAMFPQRPSAQSAFEEGEVTPTPEATVSPEDGMGDGTEGDDSEGDDSEGDGSEGAGAEGDGDAGIEDEWASETDASEGDAADPEDSD